MKRNFVRWRYVSEKRPAIWHIETDNRITLCGWPVPSGAMEFYGWVDDPTICKACRRKEENAMAMLGDLIKSGH